VVNFLPARCSSLSYGDDRARVPARRTIALVSATRHRGDLIRMMGGFALCVWLASTFSSPKDSGDIGPGSISSAARFCPLALFVTIVTWWPAGIWVPWWL